MEHDFLSSILNRENNWEESQEVHVVEGEESQEVHLVEVEESQSYVRPNNKRSRNFSNKEDEMLVSAWLNTSMDAAQGSEQPRSTYWMRIHSYFHEHKDFESDRNHTSLMHRWSDIQRGVNKFASYMADVQWRRPSGMTERDKIAEALKIYRGRDAKGEKDGEAFKFLHCWPLMQHTPKWNDLLTSKKQNTSSKKQKAFGSASPGSSTPVSTDDDDVAATPALEALKRPLGKKDAKEKRARSQLGKEANLYKEAFDDLWEKKSALEAEKEQKKQERYDRACAQEQERIRIEQENLAAKNKELELKTLLEEERIMSIDTSTMSGPRLEYYVGLQHQIAARRRNAN